MKRLTTILISSFMVTMAVAGCGTMTGAAVGAGAGAAVVAGTGYGAGKGAVIGSSERRQAPSTTSPRRNRERADA